MGPSGRVARSPVGKGDQAARLATRDRITEGTRCRWGTERHDARTAGNANGRPTSSGALVVHYSQVMRDYVEIIGDFRKPEAAQTRQFGPTEAR